MDKAEGVRAAAESGDSTERRSGVPKDKFGEYRCPASVQSISSNGSEDEAESSDSDEAKPNSANHDALTDSAMAAHFSTMCTNLPNFNTSEGTQDYPLLPSSVLTPRVTYSDLMHITLNVEAGFCLPQVLTGRMRHGRHFTFKGVVTDGAITMIPPHVDGSFVNAEKPFGVYGHWLHVFMPDDLVDAMLPDLEELVIAPDVAYPKTFLWPQWGFGITLTV